MLLDSSQDLDDICTKSGIDYTHSQDAFLCKGFVRAIGKQFLGNCFV